MKLTLEIELDDNFAREGARHLGMAMTKEIETEDADGALVIDEVDVSNEDIDTFLEEHMKITITSIYSRIVETIKLAELDIIREQQQANIEREVSEAITVGSAVLEPTSESA